MLLFARPAFPAFFTGGVNAFFISPVELVRTRLMLQFGRKPEGPSSLAGPLDCVRQVVRRHGVLGMWQVSVHGIQVHVDAIKWPSCFLGFLNIHQDSQWWLRACLTAN